MRNRLWSVSMAALGLVATLALTGCCALGTPADSAPADSSTATPAETTQPIVPPPPATSEVVTVPDALGRYYDQAAEVIGAAGLQPVDVSIHGPIDEDAGEIGLIYRQTPKAGEQVTPGTKVELRSWWESQ